LDDYFGVYELAGELPVMLKRREALTGTIQREREKLATATATTKP